MEKESSSSSLKDNFINSSEKLEDNDCIQRNQQKQQEEPEQNKMLIDFEISVIGEEEEEAEEVLTPESSVVDDSSIDDSNIIEEKKLFDEANSFGRIKNRKLIKKVTIDLTEEKEYQNDEIERKWKSKEDSIETTASIEHRWESKEDPLEEMASIMRKKEEKKARLFGVFKNNILKNKQNPPQASTSCSDLIQNSNPENDILLKHCNQNVSIEDEENNISDDKSTESAQIVTSQTDSSNSVEEEKKNQFISPSLDLAFWRKFMEADDPFWRAVVLKAVSLLSSAKTSEMTKMYIQYLKLIEKLSYSSLCSYTQIVTFAVQLKDEVSVSENDERFEQFNQHFPSLLLTILNAREFCQTNVLSALYDLVEQKVLNIEAVKNIIIGLFDFLTVSEEIVKQTTETSDRRPLVSSRIYPNGSVLKYQDEPYSIYLQSPWKSTHSLIFRLLNCVLSNATDLKDYIPSEWIENTFLPKFCFYFGKDCILMQKTSEHNRLELANSFALTAKWLGTERCEQLLLPEFQRCFNDSFCDIQNSVLAQLFDFCLVLSPKSREIVIRDLSQLFTLEMDDRWWRQRAEFAIQLNQLLSLLSIEIVNNYLCAYALTFSADRISQVRTNGILMLSSVLKTFIHHEWTKRTDLWKRSQENLSDAIPVTCSESSMPEDEESIIYMPLTFKLLAEIRSGFWWTTSWRRRQSFAHLLYLLIGRCMISTLQFYYLFFHDFMCLSDDNVPNVRQYFCLVAQFNRFEEYVGVSVIKRLEQMLVDDNDLEVRHLSKIALGKLDPFSEGLDITRRSRGLTT